MSTTYTALVNGVEGVTVTGVTRALTEGPPDSLNTADLPAQWVELPRGEARPACAGSEGGDRTMSLDMVIVLEPVAQNKTSANFVASVTMMDSIHSALVSYSSPLIGPMTWKSRLAIVTVANVAYWAIVTTIEGLG